jgi:hypothetical protein
VINAWDLRTKMMEDANSTFANPTHLDWEEMYAPGLLAGAAHGRIDATGDVIRVSLAGRISDDTFRQQVKQELAEYIGVDVDKVKGYDLWYPVEPYKVQVNYSTKVIQAIEDG